ASTFSAANGTILYSSCFFFFQAEDGIRDRNVTGVQTCALPISWGWANINLIIAHRATVVLRRVFDPKQAMEDLVNYQVEGIISSPIFLKEQLRVAVEGDYDVSNVKMIFSSGHAISPELIETGRAHV